jgi:uncharacterized protein
MRAALGSKWNDRWPSVTVFFILTTMKETFRYSPRPNDAHRIQWRHWSREAFDEAKSSDRPVLLILSAVWCRACQLMDETTFSDAAVVEMVNRDVVPVRVDADRSPHVQDRYIAGGWPTSALLAPTGEVFWSDTYVDGPELRRVVKGVVEAWKDRRTELEGEIQRRRRAMEAARSRRPTVGLVRREAADDVLTGAQEQFDTRNGGFGDAPKFVHAESIELLLTQGDKLGNHDWVVMAERTLDGMLAGEIEDRAAGGFFHYALEGDWTAPQVEKLLGINARALGAFAFAAHRLDRPDWRNAADRTVTWVESTLGRDGLWAGSQYADPAYFAADAAGRAGMTAAHVDDTIYAASSAMWIAALADAGRQLDRADWVERASTGLDTLLETMAAPDESLAHYRAPGASAPTGLLVDLLHAARASLAVAAAADRPDALEHARRLVGTLERTLWDEGGGFTDHRQGPDSIGALRFRDRPFEENSLAARLLLKLARATGERTYRAMAERILALLSPLAGRYGVEGASFAIAVEEFFELRQGR